MTVIGQDQSGAGGVDDLAVAGRRAAGGQRHVNLAGLQHAEKSGHAERAFVEQQRDGFLS